MLIPNNELDLSKLATQAASALDKNNIPIATHCINLILNSQNISQKIDALATVACKAIERNIFIPGVIDALFLGRVIINSTADYNTKIDALKRIAKQHISSFQFPLANQLVTTMLHFPVDEKTKINLLVDIAKAHASKNDIATVFNIVNQIRFWNAKPSIKASVLQEISMFCLDNNFPQQAAQIIYIAQNIR